jgi:hypothetical protein
MPSCFGGFLGMGDDHYPLPWQVVLLRNSSDRQYDRRAA